MSLTTCAYLVTSKDGFQWNDAPSGAASYSFDLRIPGGVPITAFSYTVAQKGSETGGRPRSIESVTHGDFSITRNADCRTPKLWIAVCRGDYLTEANVLVFGGPAETDPSGAGSKPFMAFCMSYVHVSSYSISYSATTGFPTETIMLKYGQMKVVTNFSNLPAGFWGTTSAYSASSGAITEEFSQVMNMPAHIFSGPGSAGGGADKM